MGEAQEFQLQMTTSLAKEADSTEHSTATNLSTRGHRRNYRRWLRMAIYTFLLLSGQTGGVLLGRLYFDKGGSSAWMATIVELAGFPLILPLYLIPPPKEPTSDHSKSPSKLILSSVYISIGLLAALACFLYSVGLKYLPVSTYSLICASQLAFNALFSFFLNEQKFTPFIVNSLVLLTISSILLVVQPDTSDSMSVSRGKYITGFLCTVGASAGYSLQLSLTQRAFKVLKKETFRGLMDMVVYISVVATVATVVGLFASGEWKGLSREMEEFELGKVSYLMTLIWTAILWAVFGLGSIGIILEASSLFSNSVSTLGLPIVPVVAVFTFHDKFGGIKVISMVLAIWGFVSYVYQHYLDDFKSKNEDRNDDDVSNSHSA